jgi:hypothetical protein
LVHVKVKEKFHSNPFLCPYFIGKFERAAALGGSVRRGAVEVPLEKECFLRP